VKCWADARRVPGFRQPLLWHEKGQALARRVTAALEALLAQTYDVLIPAAIGSAVLRPMTAVIRSNGAWDPYAGPHPSLLTWPA